MGRTAAAVTFVASAVMASAQTQAVPVRDLGPIVATTTTPIGFFFGLYAYADGRVLINDSQQRRLTLFDSTLTKLSVVGDTAAGAPVNYGRGIANPIIPFVGDSVLFVDTPSSSMLVIAPNGTIGRVTVPPKVADFVWMRSGATASDPQGRLFYRSTRPFPPRVYGAPQPAPPDSAPIVRADFVSRNVDTVGSIRIARNYRYEPRVVADGSFGFVQRMSLHPSLDDWAVHSDGSVAFLRGSDYHIDWVAPDGTRTSTPKMPFDWRRITDQDKQRMIDSVQTEFAARPLPNRSLTEGEAISQNMGSALNYVTHTDGKKYVPIILEMAPASEIPDYFPPIRGAAMKADRDGNLWILPTTSAQSRKGGLVYDIVNRRGELYERVELPVGRSIAGFGPGGSVYLFSGDRAKGFTVERARMR